MRALTKKLKSLALGDVAIRRNPLFYAAARRELGALEQAELGTRRAWVHRKLAQALRSAGRSRYARRIGAGAELGSWPLLEKSSVVREPDAFVCGATLLAAHASTGGTTGEPLPLTRSLASVAFEQACIDLMLERAGVQPGKARIAALRGDSIKDPADMRPPFWSAHAGGRRLLLSSFHLNASTIHAYADELERYAPDVLYAHPNTIDALCVQLERAGRRLALARALTSSEVLRPQVWRFIERTLGCRLLDYYGQAERVAFAYAEAPGAYRFLPGYAHVELLPAGDEGAERLYEIVGTSLWNSAMALVRYRTGDLVRLPAAWGAAELEEVALGLRSFGGILGRDGDYLISPEGTRLISPNHFLREVPHLSRIQVIQEAADAVRILVLATERFSASDQAELLANVRNKVPPSMRVSIERVEALERSARGKTPFVIHRPAVKALMARAAQFRHAA
jgi:phenylacetate-CoA ligase